MICHMVVLKRHRKDVYSVRHCRAIQLCGFRQCHALGASLSTYLSAPATTAKVSVHRPESLRGHAPTRGMAPHRPSVAPSAPMFERPRLSEREITVLDAWLRCDSKQGVANALHIAIGTVNTHLTRIRAKYAQVGRPAPTKASLVARALQDGLVTLDDL